MRGAVICLAMAAGLGMSGCASEQSPAQIDAGLKAATASAVGAEAAAIEISNAVRTPVKWTWDAKAAGKSYACDSDEQMRLPSCRAA